MKNKHILSLCSILPAFMLFWALQRGLPFSYFQALRWVVTISAILMAWQCLDKKAPWKTGVMIGVAALFNPIAPIGFPRATWRIINIAAGVLFVVLGIMEFWKIRTDELDDDNEEDYKPEANLQANFAPNQPPRLLEKTDRRCDITDGNCTQVYIPSGQKRSQKYQCRTEEKEFCKNVLQKCFPISSIRPQHYVEPEGNKHLIDFAVLYSNGVKIGIELEGFSHQVMTKEKHKNDVLRFNRLQNDGWKMLRFTIDQSEKDRSTCIGVIQLAKP